MLAEKNPNYAAAMGEKARFSLQHISGQGAAVRTLAQVKHFYEQVLVPPITYVSIVREPESRCLSYFAYYRQPAGNTLESFLQVGYSRWFSTPRTYVYVSTPTRPDVDACARCAGYSPQYRALTQS